MTFIENPQIKEETLDPQDWEEMRKLGHRMLDDIVDYLKTLDQRSVWQHMPEERKAQFSKPLPMKPQPAAQIYNEFLQDILPYPSGNIHPRFWGWVLGTGTLFGNYAELLSATMNVGASGGLSHHSANYVEYQVLDWFKQMLDYPASASGLLTSGCSAANLIGIATARNTKADYDLRQKGIFGSVKRMVVYASAQAHSSIHKAVELLGLGREGLHIIPVDGNFRIDLTALEKMIKHDRGAGLQPFCVVGGAGTTNTGAIDDLNALADICQRENLWLHVDGAFGAWAKIAPDYRELVNGMERADSLAFDLHKWMYMPYEIACVLVKDQQVHRQAFAFTPDYLAHGDEPRGMTGTELPWLHDYGFQLSRGFRALKAWMSLKEHGVEKYGRIIQKNIEQARYLEKLVESAPQLELAAPAPLNVVCFRYVKDSLDNDQTNRLNKSIEIELQESGIAVVSGTVLNGNYVLHAAITNHRSRREDFNILVDEVQRIGENASRAETYE